MPDISTSALTVMCVHDSSSSVMSRASNEAYVLRSVCTAVTVVATRAAMLIMQVMLIALSWCTKTHHGVSTTVQFIASGAAIPPCSNAAFTASKKTDMWWRESQKPSLAGD